MDLKVFTSVGTYVYEPKKDITAYELSIIVKFFITAVAVKRELDTTIPKGVSRHFIKEG